MCASTRRRPPIQPNVILSTVHHSSIGYGGETYNPGLNIPFRYHGYAARAPANRRHCKHQTFQPLALAEGEWPHVYPKHIGAIPLAVYRAYERLPVQRTAELSRLAVPPSKDGNPHDIDTATEARIRNKIINAYVQCSSFQAKAMVDNVNTKVSVAAAFGNRSWGTSGKQSKSAQARS